jgi:hypothetical protein
MNLSWSPAVPDKRFIETRVLLRVPSRVFADELLSDEVCIASVVQRIRTPPCHGGGSGFDPRSTLVGVCRSGNSAGRSAGLPNRMSWVRLPPTAWSRRSPW